MSPVDLFPHTSHYFTLILFTRTQLNKVISRNFIYLNFFGEGVIKKKIIFADMYEKNACFFRCMPEFHGIVKKKLLFADGCGKIDSPPPAQTHVLINYLFILKLL